MPIFDQNIVMIIAFAFRNQACVSLALLSQHIPNKPTVAGKGGVAAMVRLLEGFRREDRITVQVCY